MKNTGNIYAKRRTNANARHLQGHGHYVTVTTTRVYIVDDEFSADELRLALEDGMAEEVSVRVDVREGK